MARVLVLDDHEDARALLVALLRYAGHEPTEAADGETALTLVPALSPDLVISDILLPGMDGYEFVRRLREMTYIVQPAVLFYTASYLEDEARELASACGVTGVIPKPADPEETLRMIAAALRGAQPAPTPPSAEHFEREHLRVVSRKLFDKVTELEHVDEERRRLMADLVRAQEAERARIAEEIHDDSIQVMSAAALRLELLQRQLTDDDERRSVAMVARTVDTAITRLRRLMFQLRPRTLDSEGLSMALREYLEELAGDAGFEWRVEDRLEAPLPEEVRVTLFRVAQEAVRNIWKHARAQHVTLALEPESGGISMRITDDGIGFRLGEQMRYRPGHLGFASIRERVESLGGRLRVASEPGAGCTVDVWVPASPVTGLSDVSGSAQPGTGERERAHSVS